ncbi:nuclear transport factor 2 family protein [Microbacterium sp. NIBRBAC000506063]|uniref:nuclear transport factor 2 family protein n=1 Tax=Microbacterium sp. NIBRBAC000506063 TaxID=2734618 RepID=UPI001BB4EF59|nr:nuclear transport factor 2 family protein [Microbacterium sp. NIBRBAC000506063]QTV80486.1 nuclear transport factor 2 family protein [Microbacterium sp. NIBRBAC000506063]
MPTDIELIQALKASYFRAIDTKSWDDLRDVFEDDLRYFRDIDFRTPSAEASVVGADEFVQNVRNRHEHSVTVHQGHTPEITVEADTADGVWAMFDWVDNPVRDFAWQGYGHYREQYRRGADGRWRIAIMRLSRIRVDPYRPSAVGSVDAHRSAWARGELPVLPVAD